jgi:hypothetical protein
VIPSGVDERRPGPVNFSRMNPSPPKKPAPSFFVNAMLSFAPSIGRTQSYRVARIDRPASRLNTWILPG